MQNGITITIDTSWWTEHGKNLMCINLSTNNEANTVACFVWVSVKKWIECLVSRSKNALKAIPLPNQIESISVENIIGNQMNVNRIQTISKTTATAATAEKMYSRSLVKSAGI